MNVKLNHTLAENVNLPTLNAVLRRIGEPVAVVKDEHFFDLHFINYGWSTDVDYWKSPNVYGVTKANELTLWQWLDEIAQRRFWFAPADVRTHERNRLHRAARKFLAY